MPKVSTLDFSVCKTVTYVQIYRRSDPKDIWFYLETSYQSIFAQISFQNPFSYCYKNDIACPGDWNTYE